MKIQPIFFILLFILSSCLGSRKTIKIMLSGGVKQTYFYKEFHYEDFNGWIIIKATINDAAEEMNFLLDTGAPNVIKPSVATKLNIKEKANGKVGSSTNQRQSVAFTKIDNINVAGIDFEETGALIIDFEQTPDMQCLGAKIDGIIGSNLMRYALWQIDYQNQKIIITDDPDKLSLGKYEIPFTPKRQGTPRIIGTVGEEQVEFTIDTGKKGGIAIHNKRLKKLKDKHAFNLVRGIGVIGSGIFGAEKDTLYNGQVLDLKWSNLKIDTTLVTFKKAKSNLVGNTFLENFIITFDWTREILYLEPNTTYNPVTTMETFGLSYELKDNKFFVSLIYENSAAWRAGIRVGDEIVSLDGKSFEEVALTDYCQFKMNGLYNDDLTTLSIEYKRGEKTKKATLQKEFLIK